MKQREATYHRACLALLCCASLAGGTSALSAEAQAALPKIEEAPVAPVLSKNQGNPSNGRQLDLTATNNLPKPTPTDEQISADAKAKLENARHLRRTRQPQDAETILIELLGAKVPDSLKQQALLELAMAAKEEGDFPRSVQVYAQYLGRWPNDVLVPEILLRQGEVFRQMGLNNLALAKFYGVMTSSLVLKNDKLEYYQRLVLQAQSEIAETHFLLGRYAEAADFYGRLLKQSSPGLDRAQAQFRLIRSLSALGRSDETVAQGQDYLTHFPGTSEQAEVRFHLSLALKQLGRKNEAMQQVLALLREEQSVGKEHPELWAYWQQRAGNEIGNQLYREGDYVKALEIYQTLAQIDTQPSWQLPIQYQIGLTYERLAQPQKAIKTYESISDREKEVGTNASPGLKEVFEMARWRSGFIQWQSVAETKTRMPVQPEPQAASTVRNPALPKLGNP